VRVERGNIQLSQYNCENESITVRAQRRRKVAGSEAGTEERGGAEGQEHSRVYNAWGGDVEHSGRKR